jgi:hypothetical protein
VINPRVDLRYIKCLENIRDKLNPTKYKEIIDLKNAIDTKTSERQFYKDESLSRFDRDGLNDETSFQYVSIIVARNLTILISKLRYNQLKLEKIKPIIEKIFNDKRFEKLLIEILELTSLLKEPSINYNR